MKKSLLAIALALSVFALPAASFAQVATSTGSIEGHPHAYLAGDVDSLHQKGAWCLSNKFPFYRTIFYVVDGFSPFCDFATVRASMNYK